MKRIAICLTVALTLAACKEDVTDAITPTEMTDEALGHYCQMFVADHPGPKAQVHLKGHTAPLWFSQVSDAVAYVHDPEREAEITGIFVSDMSRAQSWAIPGEGNWIPAEAALLVIESRQPGGMGVPEAIPFGNTEDALAFVADNGGNVVAWTDVPEAYVRPDFSDPQDHAMQKGLK